MDERTLSDKKEGQAPEKGSGGSLGPELCHLGPKFCKRSPTDYKNRNMMSHFVSSVAALFFPVYIQACLHSSPDSSRYS